MMKWLLIFLALWICGNIIVMIPIPVWLCLIFFAILPITSSSIAHLYFVSIHPFGDGNGRIARALVIKALSQNVEKPLLTSLSTIIQKKKKAYYDALEANNKNNELTNWLIYFANTLLESQSYTQELIEFLINKTKLYESLRGRLNDRQEKVIQRMFREGLEGFQGGLNAEKYIRLPEQPGPQQHVIYTI
jgi:Fic family protein